MLHHDPAERGHIVAPDRIDHPAGEHEPRPARDGVTAREGELRVGEPGVAGLDTPGVVLAQLLDR
jgi:hypothetical protein